MNNKYRSFMQNLLKKDSTNTPNRYSAEKAISVDHENYNLV